MAGLILNLSPKERILINGAVLENGTRRGRIKIVSSGANVLRLRDALHPSTATTPVRRMCYALQLLIIGDVSTIDAHQSLLGQIEDLSQVFEDPDSRRLIAETTEALLRGAPYHALKAIRGLLPREARLLAMVKQ